MATSTLAQQFVEFVAKGLEGVQGAMKQIKSGLEAVEKALQPVNAGLKLITVSTLGWVTAGLVGTTQGNALALSFQLLSREIASIFVPTINAVIFKLQQAVQWFRNLSGDQQDTIRRWLEAAAAMTVVGIALSRVASIATTVLVPAIRFVGTVATAIATQTADAVALATGGLNLLAGALAIVVTSVAGLAVSTQSGRAALGQLLEQLRPLVEAFSNFAQRLGQTFGPVLERMGAMIGRVANSAAAIWSGAFQRMLPSLERLAVLLAQLADRLLPVFEVILIASLEGSARLVSMLVEGFRFLAEVIGGPIIAAIDNMRAALANMVEMLANVAERFPRIAEQAGLNARELRQLADAIRSSQLTVSGANQPRPRQNVSNAGGGPEQADALFRRLQTASLRTEIDPAQQTAQATTSINRLLQRWLVNGGQSLQGLFQQVVQAATANTAG